MKIIYTDVLVIGGGLAGLRMAVAAKRRGHDSIVLSLVPPKRSHSKAAQGGMQASLGNVIKGVGDNEDVHFGDTVRGSDWGADQEVVRMFVNTSPKAVRELAAWGVPWSRITPGDRQVIINGEKVTITERKEAAGLVAQRDFGGTKKWRTCYVSDCTGHSMLNAVSDRIIAEQVPVIERVEALSLIHDGKRCYGAIVRCLITGELMAYVSKATAIATGGAGRIYRVTTNAVICEGTGYDLALETGVASLGNMEAIQFHPTGIFPAGILVTEGCRGDGGLLRDVDGHRFMPDVEPEKSLYYTADRMGPVELASCAFGQSSKISYLEMAAAVCAVVNGGKLMQPYVVSEILAPDGSTIEQLAPVCKRQVLKAETSQTMREMMEAVVLHGGGRNAQIPGYRVGGKSGTSQKLDSADEKARIASFVAVAPINDPQFLCLVCLDEPHSWTTAGGSLSAPVCAEVLEQTLVYRGVPRTTEAPAASTAETAADLPADGDSFDGA